MLFMNTYDEKLDWYRNYVVKHTNATSRRDKEYVSYLTRWFSNDINCDGGTFDRKYSRKQLPMSYNEYFMG